MDAECELQNQVIEWPLAHVRWHMNHQFSINPRQRLSRLYIFRWSLYSKWECASERWHYWKALETWSLVKAITSNKICRYISYGFMHRIVALKWIILDSPTMPLRKMTIGKVIAEYSGKLANVVEVGNAKRGKQQSQVDDFVGRWQESISPKCRASPPTPNPCSHSNANNWKFTY